MFSGFKIEVGKSGNAFLIAHIVESCIFQSINQSWRGQFCLVLCHVQYCAMCNIVQYAICNVHAAYLKGNSKVYLAFSSSNLKSDLPSACQLDTKPNWNLDFKKPFPPSCPWPVLSNQIQFPMQLLIRKKAKSSRCLDLNTRIRNARSRCKRGRR